MGRRSRHWAAGQRRVAIGEVFLQRERSPVVLDDRLHELAHDRRIVYLPFKIRNNLLQVLVCVRQIELGEFEIKHLFARRRIGKPEARDHPKERK